VELNPAATADEPLLNRPLLRTWTGDGVFYSAVLLVGWWILEFRRRRLETAVFCSALGGLCLLLLPFTWRSWTDLQYPPKLHALLAPWRSVIPEEAQVIWPQNPTGAWFLLERASYYSYYQFAGDIFSRGKALEMRRRAGRVAAALQEGPAGTRTVRAGPAFEEDETPIAADGLSVQGLTLLCSDPEFDFYVTWADLRITPAAAAIIPNPAKPLRQLHLYHCSDVTQRQADFRKFRRSDDPITLPAHPALRQSADHAEPPIRAPRRSEPRQLHARAVGLWSGLGDRARD
jgi:hypothetical protein